MERLRVTVFKYGEKSFLSQLDAAGITHNHVFQLSESPINSGKVYEIATAVSDSMPWSSIARVIEAWIKARSTREVIITTKDNKVFHAKGYSVAEIQKLLPDSQVSVIDTKPENET